METAATAALLMMPTRMERIAQGTRRLRTRYLISGHGLSAIYMISISHERRFHRRTAPLRPMRARPPPAAMSSTIDARRRRRGKLRSATSDLIDAHDTRQHRRRVTAPAPPGHAPAAASLHNTSKLEIERVGKQLDAGTRGMRLCSMETRRYF